MERINYFKRYLDVANEVKKLVNQYVEADVYVFGSIIRGEYSPGLSDIDIAIVSDMFRDRMLRLKIYDLLLEKYFNTPLEFHLLTTDKWRKLLRLVGKDYIKRHYPPKDT